MRELVPVEVVNAMRQEHRRELAKQSMRVITYRKALETHGIEPPDHDDDELLALWENCRVVVSTASMFVAELRSAKELLV